MSASTSDNEGSRRTLRSSTEPIDWTLCMFCQKSDITKLSAVTTLKMSKRIINASKYDQILSVRLSSVNDLIATEGKYHCSCYKAFMRRASKASDSISTVDLAMQWLVEELKTSAKQGHILELSEVWNRYCEIAEVAGTVVPQSFVSRRKTFKEKLQSLFSEHHDFVVMHNQAVGDRQTILIPLSMRHIPITNLLDQRDCESMMRQYKAGDNEFLELVHVALRLRSDILAQPSHKGLDISEDAVMACVPDMLIRLILGGQNLFDSDTDDSGDLCQNAKVQSLTFKTSFTMLLVERIGHLSILAWQVHCIRLPGLRNLFNCSTMQATLSAMKMFCRLKVNGELTAETIQNTEQFICKLYNLTSVRNTNEARLILFNKTRSPESLPPTSDALYFHIQRAHYQAAVWRQAHLAYPTIPNPEGMGWKMEEGTLKPMLMLLSPVPESCKEVQACKCKTGCKTLRCRCKKANLNCTRDCTCNHGNELCDNQFFSCYNHIVYNEYH